MNGVQLKLQEYLMQYLVYHVDHASLLITYPICCKEFWSTSCGDIIAALLLLHNPDKALSVYSFGNQGEARNKNAQKKGRNGYELNFQVPVFLYDAAHPTGIALDTIRRELDYYRPNFMGNQWAGWSMPEVLPINPDEGPTSVSRARGISMIGARPWISPYNIPIISTDVSVARRIARMVSARGGGLPTVQTLGLVHGDDSMEIACNLLEPNRVGADRVQARVEMLAAQEGVDVEKGYFTDLSPEMIVERFMSVMSDGRL
ncbi:hypothetical protein Tsubulata_051277 [Turnera subulata]|uniref:glutamate formimidoyltransferase n=1 Tax=Turnera subulata TaxID=218843 RepID=A0A9Q0FTA7_9ROSI|nr:hypothetical protein Tsubulata_051277 [Turnera subulata]